MIFQKHLTRTNIKTLIAILSTFGMIGWILSDFRGGMVVHFLDHPVPILTIVVLYVFSLVETFVMLIRNGVRKNKIKAISHSLVISFIIFIAVFNSDIFRSKRVLTATLYDDLFHYTLVLRENGKCEINSIGMFFYTETHRGVYYLRGDTIVFKEVPYDNDFIPDTLLINQEQNLIFKDRDDSGAFIQEKQFLNHFKIEE